MNCLPHRTDTLTALLHSGRWWPAYRDAAGTLSTSNSTAGAIRALGMTASAFGCNGAIFSHQVQHDVDLTVASILVCSDECVTDAGVGGPWLRDHAAWVHAVTQQDGLVVGNGSLDASSPNVDSESEFGLVSTMAVPAPSKVGPSRMGVLCIGSKQRDYFDAHACVLLRPLIIGMAMELSAWSLRQLRARLVAKARISDYDLELLRHEALGHSSKVIARHLDAEPEAVDSRFKRLSRRLGVAFRSDAVRIARLYGLI